MLGPGQGLPALRVCERCPQGKAARLGHRALPVPQRGTSVTSCFRASACLLSHEWSDSAQGEVSPSKGPVPVKGIQVPRFLPLGMMSEKRLTEDRDSPMEGAEWVLGLRETSPGRPQPEGCPSFPSLSGPAVDLFSGCLWLLPSLLSGPILLPKPHPILWCHRLLQPAPDPCAPHTLPPT